MVLRFFFSLTAFSLASHHLLFADGAIVQEDLFEEVAIEEIIATAGEESSNSAKSTPSTPEQKAASSEPLKKLKPQYAGARRTPEKVKPPESEKKNTAHVKNKWFSSKTHPKVEKKEIAEVEQTSIELPADRPHYTKTSNSQKSYFLSQQDFSNDSARSQTQKKEEPEGYYYPRGGFQAPNGHLYFTVEWLYWRTRQEGMEFITAKKVGFDFQSGFRVGLGVHLPYDRWDIYVDYTRFNPEGSKHAHGSFYPLYLFQGTGAPQGATVAEAHAHWEIELQNVDVEIGRAFYIAKTLVFRPFFGLKGAWIDQNARVRYEGGFIPTGETFHTHFENDFKGAGPLVGVESTWLVGAGFSFFGDFATALVVGHFDNEQKQRQLGGADVVDLNSVFNLVSPTVQLIAGIAWDRNFNREQWHVGLSAGFESQYWWGQNQTEQFTDKDFPIYIREKGDLAFYGLTLRGRFDF